MHPERRIGIPHVLSTESDYVKTGSDILLMQLASGFSVGFSKKVNMISSGQVLRDCTAWPTPENRRK